LLGARKPAHPSARLCGVTEFCAAKFRGNKFYFAEFRAAIATLAAQIKLRNFKRVWFWIFAKLRRAYRRQI